MRGILCYTHAMNEDIFEKAMISLMIASDYEEYMETGNSFIMDKLIDLGFDQDSAEVTFRQLGFTEERTFGVYAECFVHFGVDDEFQTWSNQEDVFHCTRASILEALEKMKEKEDFEVSQFFC